MKRSLPFLLISLLVACAASPPAPSPTQAAPTTAPAMSSPLPARAPTTATTATTTTTERLPPDVTCRIGDEARLRDMVDSALSPDGEQAVTSAPGHLSIWKTRDCSLLADRPNDPPLVTISVIGGRVVGIESKGPSPKLVRVDLASGARAVADLGRTFSYDHAAPSPDGRQLFVALQTSESPPRKWIRAYDLEAMQESWHTEIPSKADVGAIVVAPDSKAVYAVRPTDAGDYTSLAIELDPASGAVRRTLSVPGSSQQTSAAMINGGKTLVVNTSWVDLVTGKAQTRPQWSLPPVSGCPDCTKVTVVPLSVSSDSSVVLWAPFNGLSLGHWFAWPANEPLTITSWQDAPDRSGHLAVGRDAILECNYPYGSGAPRCFITRARRTD